MIKELVKKAKERLTEASTGKGIAEFLAGLGIIGLSENEWQALIGVAVALYGAVDVIRNERKGE